MTTDPTDPNVPNDYAAEGAPALERLTLTEQDLPPALSLPNLPQGEEISSWLLERVLALRACLSPAFAAASVGALARHGSTAAVQTARAWRQELSEADAERVLEDAHRQLGELFLRLEEVALAQAIDLRDVLESVVWALPETKAKALGADLAYLDSIVPVLIQSDPRWTITVELSDLRLEVGWREPWLWWGQP